MLLNDSCLTDYSINDKIVNHIFVTAKKAVQQMGGLKLTKCLHEKSLLYTKKMHVFWVEIACINTAVLTFNFLKHHLKTCPNTF